LRMGGAELLRFHREITAIPSISHEERALADHLEDRLRRRGVRVERVGDNLIARAGRGPRLLLNTHIDTVPPGTGWTRDPFRVECVDGRVYGLGANDAKASVAAMVAAFFEVAETGGPCEVALLLAPEEETGGRGTEVGWPALRDSGFDPAGVVVGEPTGLDVARAQKGLLVLELVHEGQACHAANADALSAVNPIPRLGQDLATLEAVPQGPEHPLLGRTTLQPTLLEAGSRRNMVPGRAAAWLDVRTVPGDPPEAVLSRIRPLLRGRLRVHSDRLGPRECPEDASIVRAALRARPEARVYGSRTMSDLVFFDGVPAVKCGPGRSERSHTPDEHVLEAEILAGASFYSRLVAAFAEEAG
jgi:acetylornithine deacetylase